MKALTLHQPWASLVALGVKTIETRSWSTKYRGPLAIHAGLKTPGEGQAVGDWYCTYRPTVRVPMPSTGDVVIDGRWIMGRDGQAEAEHLPLGAVVATCTLVDVVPIEVVLPGVDRPRGTPPYSRGHDKVTTHPLSQSANLYRFVGNNGYDITDQRPYGDFTPGRFAWLLDDVKPTTERCPRCSGRGMTRTVTDGGTGQVCRTCNGNGRCDPVLARGRQGIWNWTS